MKNFTSWFSLPEFDSWISAVLLATIVSICASSLTPLWNLLNILFGLLAGLVNLLALILMMLPDFIQVFLVSIVQSLLAILGNVFSFIFTVSAPLLLIVPIVVIAFADHFFNLLLDRFFPDFRPSSQPKATGYFPSLTSWWEGLYGLLVIIISLLCSDIFLSLFPFMGFDVVSTSTLEPMATTGITFWYNAAIRILAQPIYSPIFRLVVWIPVVAYLYHFETIVRKHFISISSSS